MCTMLSRKAAFVLVLVGLVACGGAAPSTSLRQEKGSGPSEANSRVNEQGSSRAVHRVPGVKPNLAEKYTPSIAKPAESAADKISQEADVMMIGQPGSMTQEQLEAKAAELKAMAESMAKSAIGGASPTAHGLPEAAASESSEVATEYQGLKAPVQTDKAKPKDKAVGGMQVNGVFQFKGEVEPKVPEKNLAVLNEEAVEGGMEKTVDAPKKEAPAGNVETATVPPTPTKPVPVEYCFKCVMNVSGKGLVPCGAGQARIVGTAGLLGPDMARAATNECVAQGKRVSPSYAQYCFADDLGPCPKEDKARYVFNCYVKNPQAGKDAAATPYLRCPIPGPNSHDVLFVTGPPGQPKEVLAQASNICAEKNSESIAGCMAVLEDMIQVN